MNRIAVGLASLALLAGCTAASTPAPPASLSVGPSPSPTFSPAPSAAASSVASPAPSPTPIVLYSVTKNAEGAHGGAPAVSLPASVVVDYTVRGTCDFTVAFQPPTGPAVKPAMSLSVRGEASGTASFVLVPGPYAAVPGEAVGCTFTFVVRQPG